MDKRKKGVWSLFTDHVEWWQNYLTEISVLVVGLGLTYWADAQWDRMEQEVQDGELLQMVAEELDANLTEMEHMEEYYRKEIDFTVWLARSALGITGAAHKAADELLRKIENRHRPDGG